MTAEASPQPRTPGLTTFALIAFLVSCLLSLALDWGPVSETPNPVGSLIGGAFPAALTALAVACVSFRDPKGRRSLLWRAAPPAAALGLARALQFAAGLSPVGADGRAPAELVWIGGLGVFLVGAGLCLLAVYGARAALSLYDRRVGANEPARPRPVLAYPQFALVLTPVSLVISELLVGPGLPPPHWLNLASVTALPLGFALLAGLAGFHRAPPERPLGRRMAPAMIAYVLVWLLRGVIANLEAGPWGVLLSVLSGLATGFIIVTLASAALYAAQGVLRWRAARSAR